MLYPTLLLGDNRLINKPYIQCLGDEGLMRDEDKQKIAEIMSRMQCPKNFICAETGFENLCKSNDFGVDGYIDCLEDIPSRCPFAISFGNGYICRCPLRVFLAKELGK
jgi:hypothetical protein